MDRLVWLLNRFELRSRVFHSGPLCRKSSFDAGDGLGYLHVIRSGRVRLETAKQPARKIDEPSVILYLNPVSHRLVPEDSDTDLVCASFDCGLARGNPLGRAVPDVIVIALGTAPSLAAVLELLFWEAAESHCGRQAVLDRLSEVAIVHLLRDLMDESRLEVGVLAGLSDARLARAINAMHEDPSRGWTLSELASVAGMSRARFANRFRETVGQPPGAYLSEWRIGVARSLLLKGKPVKVIAAEVGYGNASALSRAFVAHSGQSPREWLKAHEAR